MHPDPEFLRPLESSARYWGPLNFTGPVAPQKENGTGGGAQAREKLQG